MCNENKYAIPLNKIQYLLNLYAFEFNKYYIKNK